MKQQYLEPAMEIEVFGNDIFCNINGWFESGDDFNVIIDEPEDM